ncbi:MAG: alkaline phosphatase family protein [Muribaculaceae bacterium]|nr:alkaline phosphatase family protein [Muribaculaceae bacterium]
MRRLLTTMMMGLAGIQGSMYLAAENRPRLVVGIMVDQLRTDYLEQLKDMFGQGGFRRLMDGSLYYKDIDFKVVPGDAASASAVVQTGTYPRYNGIVASFVYDPASKSLRHIFSDDNYIGNFTDEKYSPAALRVTTLTDELTIEEKGKTRIHSIAPESAQALVMAGHTGNSAFWINDESGRWSSTTYYQNPPAYLQNLNYNSPLVARLDTIRWTPVKGGEPYPLVDVNELKSPFRYSFPRSDRDVFSNYKQSPYVNRDITEAAAKYLEELNLGKNAEFTDVLNLGLTLTPYPGAEENYRYTLEDAYLRLDSDLEKFFNALDRQVGRDNLLIYLISTGYFNEPAVDSSKYRLPGGTFSVKRAISLLNAYLSAKYGNGAYIERFVDNQIYFSAPLLEEKGIETKRVAEDARDFLVRMSGVADAFTMADLLNPSIDELDRLRLAVDPKSAGDIFVEFSPGWTVVDDSKFPSTVKDNKNTAYQFPGFILIPGENPKVVEETIEAVDIAPKIAGALKIRPPNGINN